MLIDANTVVSIIAAIIAATAAIFTFFERRRDWYVNAVTLPRLQWGENVRKRLADLITAFYEDDKECLDAKIDCLMLYLTPSNRWHKGLVEQLGKMKRGEDTDLNTLIKAAQTVLRYNWWAVKTESLVSYKMDKKRDEKLVERAKAHAAEEVQKKLEPTKAEDMPSATDSWPTDMTVNVYVTQKDDTDKREDE